MFGLHRHQQPQSQPPMHVEYGVVDDRGDLCEWPCGCPRLFHSEEQARDCAEVGGHLVTRRVFETPWEPLD